MGYKQILIIRKDLKMRRGKEIAQAAHASLKAVLNNVEHPDVKGWLSNNYKKIAVSVDSEEELIEIYEKAKKVGIITELVTDLGLTEFKGVETKTCISVGPGPESEIDNITGHLKLL